MNEPPLEREVPPRSSDKHLINLWLLNHPFIHFGVVFCYWFTATSLLDWAWIHWLHRSFKYEGETFVFALLMAAVFYYTHRRQLHRPKP